MTKRHVNGATYYILTSAMKSDMVCAFFCTKVFVFVQSVPIILVSEYESCLALLGHVTSLSI